MKIYGERETANHYIFEIRPSQLFDLSSSDESRLHPQRREASLTAVNKVTARREVFALAKHKDLGEFAKTLVANAPETPLFLRDPQS